MKLIKLTETNYIIVNDSEIKDGDWMIRDGEQPTLVTPNFWWDFGVPYKKITHSTQPLESICCTPFGQIKRYVDCKGCDQEQLGYDKIQLLSLSEVKELIGEVDVEKKVDAYCSNKWEYSKEENKESFVNGYNQALEDNKGKKYTEEDIKKAIEMAREEHCYADDLSGYYWSKEEIIQFLQPKTEWEVEIIEGKLKLK